MPLAAALHYRRGHLDPSALVRETKLWALERIGRVREGAPC
jgi:hypothetical protein